MTLAKLGSSSGNVVASVARAGIDTVAYAFKSIGPLGCAFIVSALLACHITTLLAAKLDVNQAIADVSSAQAREASSKWSAWLVRDLLSAWFPFAASAAVAQSPQAVSYLAALTGR